VLLSGSVASWGRRGRRLVLLEVEKTSATSSWIRSAVKKLIAAMLGSTNRSNKSRVEDDQRRAWNNVDADHSEAVVGVKQRPDFQNFLRRSYENLKKKLRQC